MIGIEEQFFQRPGIPQHILRNRRQRAVTLVHIFHLPVTPLEYRYTSKHDAVTLSKSRSSLINQSKEIMDERERGGRWGNLLKRNTHPEICHLPLEQTVLLTSRSYDWNVSRTRKRDEIEISFPQGCHPQVLKNTYISLWFLT